ncbi:hypothetical protein DPMN_163818 [Dreissena polymorpha]|uniref:Uncharacterized protein n=1 Tax=Dreissena polymorpha TaxID=45954 RepID=A0A9D4ESJ2_DREPO|nr:hypothetical protein DPMN_163818 [Dreissena polymorpha]
MALSNAERQRRFRAKRDAVPAEREKYLMKGRERYKQECNSGKRKPVEQLAEREKRPIRKRWRIQKRKDRARERETRNIFDNIQTPVSSSDERQSIRNKSSIKRKRREEAKVYRDKRKLEPEVSNLQKKVAMFKKRLYRKTEECSKLTPDTPKKRTRKLLRHLSSKDAKRSLFKCEVIMEAIRRTWRKEKGQSRFYQIPLQSNS